MVLRGSTSDDARGIKRQDFSSTVKYRARTNSKLGDNHGKSGDRRLLGQGEKVEEHTIRTQLSCWWHSAQKVMRPYYTISPSKNRPRAMTCLSTSVCALDKTCRPCAPSLVDRFRNFPLAAVTSGCACCYAWLGLAAWRLRVNTINSLPRKIKK